MDRRRCSLLAAGVGVLLLILFVASGDHASLSAILSLSTEGLPPPSKVAGRTGAASAGGAAGGGAVAAPAAPPDAPGPGGCPACAAPAPPFSGLPGDVSMAWDGVKHGKYGASLPRRKCIIGTFASDWDHFAYMIENSTLPFAIARYGDGERNLIQGKEIGQGTQAFSEDKFFFEGGESELGRDLAWSLTGHFGSNYYYGFASPIDDGAGLRWYLQHTQQQCPFITYANIFVNKNYVRTKALLLRLFETQMPRLVILANHEGMARFVDMYRPPPEVQYMSLPDGAPHFFRGEARRQLIGNATALARSRSGALFIVSGGPMAKPLIAFMWGANPKNQYIDVGSSLDEIFKGRKTRPYMPPGTSYAEQSDPSFTVDDNDRPVLVNYDYLGG